jgi:CheY-like chemotaxis protein
MHEPQPPPNILVVDDDVDFLAQVQAQLEAAGYRVTTAESLAQADTLLGKGRPDLAIVDLMMEHTDDGFVLCHRIRQLHPAMPIILVTAVTSETGFEFDPAADKARSWIQADALLDKPVRLEQLTREIDRLLKG